MGAGSARYTESMCWSEQIPKCLGSGPPSGSQSLGGGSHNCNLQKEGIQRVLSLLDDSEGRHKSGSRFGGVSWRQWHFIRSLFPESHLYSKH